MKSKTLTVALCIVALSPALVFAGKITKPKAGEEQGLIKAVDVNAHTLIVNGHQHKTDRTFSWNDQTQFTENHKAVGPEALKAGEQVRLTFAPGGNSPVLKTVRITPAKASKPTANDNSTTRSPNAKS